MSEIIKFPKHLLPDRDRRIIQPCSVVPSGLDCSAHDIPDWYIKPDPASYTRAMARLKPVYGRPYVGDVLESVHDAPYWYGEFTDLLAYYSRWRPPPEQEEDITIVALGTHCKFGIGLVNAPMLVFPVDRYSYNPHVRFRDIGRLGSAWFLLVLQAEAKAA